MIAAYLVNLVSSIPSTFWASQTFAMYEYTESNVLIVGVLTKLFLELKVCRIACLGSKWTIIAQSVKQLLFAFENFVNAFTCTCCQNLGKFDFHILNLKFTWNFETVWYTVTMKSWERLDAEHNLHIFFI